VIHPTTTLKENPMAETATAEHPLVAQQHQPHEVATMPGFTSNANWELAQRIGKAFASSDLVPQQYRGNLANCIVALEMANRMGASPLMVMQNLYIVHGNPGWSSKFLIACFNQCGRFSALRYEWNDARSECRAWAVEKATGERIEGPTVSIEMAREEGWSTKSGSKWKTMPELMLMYRAAAFLIRTYAPEISMGLRTDDEIVDRAGRHGEWRRAAPRQPGRGDGVVEQAGACARTSGRRRRARRALLHRAGRQRPRRRAGHARDRRRARRAERHGQRPAVGHLRARLEGLTITGRRQCAVLLAGADSKQP
jgi:hypothetical protein